MQTPTAENVHAWNIHKKGAVVRDRAYLESLPSWKATIHAPSGIVCLTRNLKGGYYWDIPDYSGMFPWGAMSSFEATHFRDALARGRLILLSGRIP